MSDDAEEFSSATDCASVLNEDVSRKERAKKRDMDFIVVAFDLLKSRTYATTKPTQTLD